ncbi:AAA family ATPase [uncultured Psychrobacillus sp.]|uniref:AAA family ATPase n=1 Tax=uncultured Psychrobacillus sp. TaxID=1551585 RepID=UPI00261DFDBA|nr:AAA family ATPase [uncultured Psychrobacillus sp.]
MFLKKVMMRTDENILRDEYPFTIPTIQNFRELELINNVTFFVGENGTGKSTLLEAIADQCEFNTAGGGRNNYYEVDAAESALGKYLKLSWMPKVTNGFFLRAETFYQFASHVTESESIGSYGGKSLHEQSHGESFLSLFLHRFNGRAIYLLDEPEAALSPQRQLAFLKIMHDLIQEEDCQFIIATHSPIILGFPEATILSFDDGHIKEVEYEQTAHYQTTKYFLDHREKFLKELLEGD